jgi:hypothetical protein
MAAAKKHEPFCQRLVHLISEPEFLRFENILREPNIFKIVGRSHYERWHSCFWGWLLDPNGTHLLKDYTLLRLLSLLFDQRALGAKDGAPILLRLPVLEFSDVDVLPNEFVPSETSVEGVGRFDVFVTATFADRLATAEKKTGRLNVLFEFKIDCKPTEKQSRKYSNWLRSTHPGDENLLVYVTPSLARTSLETVGDDQWFCLDYQLLNDKLLIPLIEHPALNEKVKPFVIQYVKNLKIRQKGVKMAITNEERKMALALYEKYSDVFDSIFDALVDSKVIKRSTSAHPKGRASGRIAVRIDKKIFDGQILAEVFEKVLKFLVDSGHLRSLPLPWGTTNQRYILSNDSEPTHPNGRPFFYPIEYRGYTMESHYSREQGMRVLQEVCEKLKLPFEIITV